MNMKLGDKWVHRLYRPEDPPVGGTEVDQAIQTAVAEAKAASEPPPPDPIVEPPAPVEPPPAAPQFTDEQIQEAMRARGLVAVPVQQVQSYQQTQAQDQAAQQAQQLAAQQQAEAEKRQARIAELKDLQWTDPEEYQRQMQIEAQSAARQVALQIDAERREAPVIAAQIIASIKKEVPNLPQEVIDQFAAELADPSLTVAQLKMAQQNGIGIAVAKQKAYDLNIPKGESPRPPNDVAPAPGAAPQPTVQQQRQTSQAELMARTLGIPVEDITSSPYLAPAAKGR